MSVALIVSMLAVSTPAAPQLFTGLAAQWQWNLAFWYESSGWAKSLHNLVAPAGNRPAQKPERQAERDARVARVQISPGEVTALAGERVRFAAIAYDHAGAVVSGVKFKWRALDAEHNRPVRISRLGDFESRREGNFRVIVEGAGQQAQTLLKVLKNELVKTGEQPTRVKKVSTRDLPPDAPAQQSKGHRAPKKSSPARRDGEAVFTKASFKFAAPAAAPAAAVRLINNEWNEDNYTYADDPGNTRGNPPGTPEDDGAGSGNFQFTAPVLGLTGRGLGTSLGLAYNSRVWSKTSSYEITYDADKDWPAAGWSLGFGRLIGMNASGSMLVDPDGTRHSFNGTVSIFGGSTSFYGYSVDGTNIDYSTGSYNGVINWGSAKLPNGTIVDYGAPGSGAVYPTRITDPNGNYTTITYRNNRGPEIETVTDTLGRAINFHYDANGLLTAVTAPGYAGAAPRTLVRLHYKQHPLQFGFAPGLTPRVRNSYPWVIDAIYYPGTNTGYWFGDGDSYSSYGMIAKASERRGMGFAAGSLNEMGTITSAGSASQEMTYNYPLAPDSTLTDAPTYTTRTHTWDGMDTTASVTTYAVDPTATNPSQPATPSRKVEITLPDGSKNVQYSYNYSHLADSDPLKVKDGLVYEDETRDANGVVLQGSRVGWEQGAYESARPVYSAVTDERGQTKGTEFSYGPAYNQLTEVRTYNYGYVYGGANELLRRTATQYVTSSAYTGSNTPYGHVGRHIFNLPSVVEVYAPDNTRLSRTEYLYDGATASSPPNGSASLADLPTDVVMHDESFNPFAETTQNCYWTTVEDCSHPLMGCFYRDEYVCEPYNPYSPSTDYRGNLTQVTSYANAAADPAAGASVETRRYDITGNLVSTSTSCCEQTSFTFTQDTQYAYATSQSRGAANPGSTQRVTTSTTYDFNTGLSVNSTDVNGRVTSISYSPNTLRAQRETLPTNAYTDFLYDDTAMTLTRAIYLAPPPYDTGALAYKSVVTLNGLGETRREEALGANGVWDIVETKFDKLGRAWKQTRPYRSGQTPQWNEAIYDGLGRTTSVILPDGSESKTFFNEAGRPDVATNTPGETARVVDAWGRERWGRRDALGRMVEVVEANPQGDGTVASQGLLTTYAYSPVGKLVEVNQDGQLRRFQYDSLGRLTHQKLAETSATLDGGGQFVGVGGYGAQWSDVFTYDSRSNVATRTDARGVVTGFNYNNDPLNRLQSVTYTVGAQHDTSSPIAAAPSVSYEYATGGNPGRLLKINAAGVSAREFGYDAEGRVNSITTKLSARLSHPLQVNYAYDTLDRITDVTNPAEYQLGVSNPTRKVVHHDYDVSSRLSNLKVNGVDYASQLVYDASSQTTSLKVGAAGANQVTESYSYDEATGLLNEQRVYRGTDPNQNKLLHLAYDYLRTGTNAGRTGQLTKITNHLDAQKGRTYTYDKLGRLTRATGGDPNGTASWTQDYAYDRYGNRTGVTATGNQAASLVAPADPAVKLPHVEIASNLTPSVPENLRTGDERRGVTDAPDRPALFGAARGSLTATASLVDAPTALTVSSVSNTAVNLSWTAPAGAVDHYEVERKQTAGGAYTFVGNAPAAGFNDTGVSAGTAYLYRVRAVTGGGSRSSYSNAALGAAVTFTDGTITAGVTVIKAQHVTELRQAVNAVRQLAGLSAATWTDSALSSLPIRAVHVQEMRDRLNEALTALGVTTSPFTDPTLATGANGTLVKKAHVEELRDRASRGSGGLTAVEPLPVPRDGHAALSYDAATNRISTTGWEYDAAGNQTRSQTAQGGWQRMEYDAANRLVRVTNDARSVVYAAYTYGENNARLVTQEGSTRTFYAWGMDSVVAEYTEVDGSPSAASPQWSKNYIYLGSSRLLATQAANIGGEVVEFHHPDRLGTRLVTNSANNTYYEQAALPFGTVLSGESTGATNRRFTSYARSAATGMDYAVNRHYDALQGRFTQVDPLEMDAVNLLNPQSLNLYAYCANDPVNHLDPDGLLFGFFKKLFKGIAKLFKAVVKLVAKAFVAAAKVALKLLTSKWGQLLIGIAIIAFLGPGAPLGFALLGVEGATATLGVVQTSLLLAGVQGAGVVANHLQKKGVDKKKKKRPGAFQTLTAAAIWALKTYNPQSIATDLELAGEICERPNGEIIVMAPNPATSGPHHSSPTPCSAGSTRVGEYHTHGAESGPAWDDENFSPADRTGINNDGSPGFLGTPSGRIKRFDPAVIPGSTRGKVTVLKTKTH